MAQLAQASHAHAFASGAHDAESAAFGPAQAYPKDCEIYCEGAPALSAYRVVAGAVRIVRYLDDGRRHIAAFCLPGDVFGWDLGEAYAATAEALGPCRIAPLRRSALDAAIARGGAAAEWAWRLLAAAHARSQEHMLVLARLNAQERVQAFLCGLARRQGEGASVRLPMSRLDMADHLGLTIETVSRTMTQLERDGLIRMPSARRVMLTPRLFTAPAQDSAAAASLFC